MVAWSFPGPEPTDRISADYDLVVVASGVNSRLLDMPMEQKDAIGKMRYNDISVMNMCFDRRIYDGALITS